jgi:hypothetical protein
MDLNSGAFMKILRSALPVALTLALSVNVFAQDDDDEFAPRGGMGTITIITNPPNSDIFLDGEFLGKSPIVNRQFRTGPLRLVIQDQNKELVNTRFNVWPNRENKYETKTVMPHGAIKVTTNPSKCNIYLNGELADRTDGGDLTITNVDAGSHTLAAECGGRLSFETLLLVKGEQMTEVHLDVQRKTAKATIDGEDVTEK